MLTRGRSTLAAGVLLAAVVCCSTLTRNGTGTPSAPPPRRPGDRLGDLATTPPTTRHHHSHHGISERPLVTFAGSAGDSIAIAVRDGTRWPTSDGHGRGLAAGHGPDGGASP
jgi:hypothetical protein